jgi:hypothetical protein
MPLFDAFCGVYATILEEPLESCLLLADLMSGRLSFSFSEGFAEDLLDGVSLALLDYEPLLLLGCI